MPGSSRMPGPSNMRRQGRRMLEWLKQELGLSKQTPIVHHFWETNLFWGGLAIGIGLVVAAWQSDAPWVLIAAWPFFFIACVATFKNLQSRRKRWVLTIGSSMVLASVLLTLNTQYLDRPSFSAEVELRVSSHGDGYYSGFWAMWNRGNDCFISPLDALLFIRITNLKSKSTMVTGYQVEVKDGKSWRRLHKIDLRNSTAIFTSLRGFPYRAGPASITLPPGAILLNRPFDDYALTNSGVVAMELIDGVLEKKSLGSGESTRGWVAFDYAHQKIDMRNDVHLTLTDEQGLKTSFIIALDVDKEQANLLQHPITLGPSFDVSRCTRQDFPF